MVRTRRRRSRRRRRRRRAAWKFSWDASGPSSRGGIFGRLVVVLGILRAVVERRGAEPARCPNSFKKQIETNSSRFPGLFLERPRKPGLGRFGGRLGRPEDVLHAS
eukprot:3105254-Pyramimonas_sp.AAC.1